MQTLSCSTWDPVLWPGVILGPLPWECGIVTTWSSGKSLLIYFIYNYVFMLIPNQSCPHSAWHIASTQHILKNNSSNRWIIFLCFSISLWCFCEPQGQCIYIATPTNSHLPIHLSMYPSICIFFGKCPTIEKKKLISQGSLLMFFVQLLNIANVFLKNPSLW